MQRRSHTSTSIDDIENNSSKTNRTSHAKYKSSQNKIPSTLRQIYIFGILSIICSLYFIFYILPGPDSKLQEQESMEDYSIIMDELKLSLEDSQNKLSQKDEELEKIKSELQTYKQNEEELIAVKNELLKTKDELHEQRPAKTDVGYEKDKKAIKQLKKQVSKYTKEIQAISRREVEEKFGVGPHKVEITIEFPPEAPFSETTGTFIIELAPLDLMPHAVYLFLQQVSHGLWDGLSFHRNAEHVIQAGADHYFNTPDSVREGEGAFKKLHLQSLSFQEYSEKYPHVQYTIGFAGRPGKFLDRRFVMKKQT